MPKVLGLGIATIDYIVSVDKFPNPDDKIRSENWSIEGGGNCANTLVALSRLGIQTSILTKIGTDSIGKHIKESLNKEDVSTENLHQSGDASPYSFIIVDTNQNTRTIIHHPGALYSDDIPFNDNSLDNVDLLYLDGRFYKTAKQLALNAKKQEIPIVLEAERTGLYVEDILQFVDVVITSERYHHDYFGNNHFKANLERMIAQGPSIAITTLGEKGSIARMPDQTILVDAYKTEVVDTTGAGDAFIAGFIYGYIKDWNIKRCLDFASKLSAKKCQEIGCRKGLPYLNDIE